MLLAVVAAGAVVVCWCVWVSYELFKSHRQSGTRRQPLATTVREERLPYLVLYVVLVLFFLYPQVR
jgi:hypothetical protein